MCILFIELGFIECYYRMLYVYYKTKPNHVSLYLSSFFDYSSSDLNSEVRSYQWCKILTYQKLYLH